MGLKLLTNKSTNTNLNTMGRKKIEDRSLIKVKIEACVEQFRVDKLGGKEAAKKFVINAINEKTDENDKV